MARAKQAELDFDFELPLEAESTSFIDLGQCNSLVNRIFSRQGMQYAISGMSVTGTTAGSVRVFRLPQHWPCINAWEKGYHIWRASQQQVLDIEPGIAGRYRDYKVFMNQAHIVAGSQNNLIPEGYEVTGFGVAFGYDWEMSDIQIPNDPAPGTTTEYNMHMLGGSVVTSKGLISGYGASRSRPQQVDPNIPDNPAESWMREVFDVGDNLDEIREDLELENDEPPYVVGVPGDPTTFYPGGAVQGTQATEVVNFITRAGLGTQTATGGFTAPCGLLQVIVDGEFGNEMRLKIHLMPGSYKGCMARPMRDVN